jgi:hypothetical protein
LPLFAGRSTLIFREENGVIQAQANQGQATMLQTGITMGLEAAGAMEAIEHGLNTFMEAVPQLMAALDEVAKVCFTMRSDLYCY